MKNIYCAVILLLIVLTQVIDCWKPSTGNKLLSFYPYRDWEWDRRAATVLKSNHRRSYKYSRSCANRNDQCRRGSRKRWQQCCRGLQCRCGTFLWFSNRCRCMASIFGK